MTYFHINVRKASENILPKMFALFHSGLYSIRPIAAGGVVLTVLELLSGDHSKLSTSRYAVFKIILSFNWYC